MRSDSLSRRVNAASLTAGAFSVVLCCCSGFNRDLPVEVRQALDLATDLLAYWPFHRVHARAALASPFLRQPD